MVRKQIIEDSHVGNVNSWELIHPYRKSLKIYFDGYYGGNAIFLAISVFNSGVVGIVCPAHEAWDAFSSYAQSQDWTSEEKDEYFELAMAQSFYL